MTISSELSRPKGGQKPDSLRGQLPVVARRELLAELAAYFRSVTRIPEKLGDGLADEPFVRNVVDVLHVTRA
jgi:hypothetical protein